MIIVIFEDINKEHNQAILSMPERHVVVVLLLLLVTKCLNSLEVPEPDEDDHMSVFEPTNEWQVIKPGQSIPPGLHVRIDMQTGLKEAKLMDSIEAAATKGTIQVSGSDNTNDNTKDEVSGGYGHSDRRGIINKTKKLFSRKELSEMLQNLKDDSHLNNDIPLISGNHNNMDDNDAHQPPPNKKDFLTIDDLREIVTFHSDVELMLDHLQVLTNSNATSNEIIQSLIELEYYVHQIDNARDLDTLGGLAAIVRLLNHSDNNVKCAAAFTFGAAVQSNPEVQEKALSYRALQSLLNLLIPSSSDILKRRTLYALGSLLRGHPLAIKQFILDNGIDRISIDIQKYSGQVVVKIMTLLTDLLNFEKLEERTDIKRSFVLSALSTNGWCSHVQMFLDSNDLKQLETSILFMRLLTQVCDFSDTLSQLQSLQLNFLNDTDMTDVTEALQYIISRINHKQEL